jgi:ribosomal protein L11 methyltransferase
MKHALFAINSPYSSEEALKELYCYGLQNPYFIEEMGLPDTIGGFFDQLPPLLISSTLIEHNEGIDWDKEWKTHSPYYKEGLLEIDLNDFGVSLSDSKIYLKPGSGFGDLSHPTTYLMLKTMTPYIKGKTVIDIGCGSGILSLAAHKMGASSVIGLDIDDEALDHSRENALLNNMNSLNFYKILTTSQLETKDIVFLINMTLYEQQNVFLYYPNLEGIFITSGILNYQKNKYLNQFPYNFSMTESFEKDSWISLVISN